MKEASIGYKQYSHKNFSSYYLVVRTADGDINQFGLVMTKADLDRKLIEIGIDQSTLKQQEGTSYWLREE